MSSRVVGVLALFGILILGGIAIFIYMSISNYFFFKKNKKKVVFKEEDGKIKGYWRTKKADTYDEDLKLED